MPPHPTDDSGAAGRRRLIAEWLAAHGDALYGYALRRVKSRDQAQEMRTAPGGRQKERSNEDSCGEPLPPEVRKRIIDHIER